MTASKPGKIALLWRGDRQARGEATAQNNRYNRVFEALAALGIEAEPAVYADDMADEVRGAASRLRRGAGLGRSDFGRTRTGWRSMRCCATSLRVACG